MATNNTVIFDQVYKVLESFRSLVRDNYDRGMGESDRMIYFRLVNNNKQAVKCEEDDEGAVGVKVSWDNNNANLRTLAREVMHYLNSD